MSNGYNDLASERLLLSRIWASPPEIFRSEMTLGVRYGGLIEGRKFLLRSDFPVYLFIDNNLVGAAGEPSFPAYYRFSLGSKAEGVRQRRVEFRFPTGWGGNPAGGAPIGGLVQGDILARHGVACLDASWSDEAWPELPNPLLLPQFCAVLSNLTVTAGTTNPAWGTQTQGIAQFRLANQRLPNEFYVNNVSVNTEMSGTYNALQGVFCYEWQLRKTNTPAGDNQFFLILNQNQAQMTTGISYPIAMKLPLRSIFSAWAAETPTLDMTCFGSIDPLIAPIVHARLSGGYII
jgi:hypothetical protein